MLQSPSKLKMRKVHAVNKSNKKKKKKKLRLEGGSFLVKSGTESLLQTSKCYMYNKSLGYLNAASLTLMLLQI